MLKIIDYRIMRNNTQLSFICDNCKRITVCPYEINLAIISEHTNHKIWNFFYFCTEECWEFYKLKYS